jgi:S1-C subfamily serine protease
LAQANATVYDQTLRGTTWVISVDGTKPTAQGSGALIDASQRLMVTNFHVVENRPHVIVFFPAFESEGLVTTSSHYLNNASRLGIKGKVLLAEAKRDLAVIQLERLPAGVRPLPLARRSSSPGTLVHSIGNSDANNGTLWRYLNGPVRGVFAKKIRSGNRNVQEFQIDAKVVETQMPANPGDSGGPVVNDQGELVGIHHGSANGALLVSLEIDISEVRAILSGVSRASRADGPEEVAARPAEGGEAATEAPLPPAATQPPAPPQAPVQQPAPPAPPADAPVPAQPAPQPKVEAPTVPPQVGGAQPVEEVTKPPIAAPVVKPPIPAPTPAKVPVQNKKIPCHGGCHAKRAGF